MTNITGTVGLNQDRHVSKPYSLVQLGASAGGESLLMTPVTFQAGL